jgi:hypothetical protein
MGYTMDVTLKEEVGAAQALATAARDMTIAVTALDHTAVNSNSLIEATQKISQAMGKIGGINLSGNFSKAKMGIDLAEIEKVTAAKMNFNQASINGITVTLTEAEAQRQLTSATAATNAQKLYRLITSQNVTALKL